MKGDMQVNEGLQGLWERTYQVAVVVRDLDAAAAFYAELGIGPFDEGPSEHAVERYVYGRLEPDARVRGATTQMGPIQFELLQPLQGKTVQSEFLATHGEGVIHICATTDDLDRDTALLGRKGFAVISSGSFPDGARFAYFDTRSIGGLILELAEFGSHWR